MPALPIATANSRITSSSRDFSTNCVSQFGRACRRLGELIHQGLDQQPRVGPDFGTVGNVADRLDLGAVGGNGGREELLRGSQHVVQLLRDLMRDRLVGTLGADIGRVEVAAGRRVELALVGDQDVDGALQLDRRAERVFEPDVEIMRGRRDARRSRPWPSRPLP